VPFPEEKQRPAQTPESERTIIALDPGECIFQSAYSVDHTVAYGNKAEDDQKKARLEAAHSAAVAAYNAAKREGTPYTRPIATVPNASRRSCAGAQATEAPTGSGLSLRRSTTLS